MEIIIKYFQHLSDLQKNQFGALYNLYEDWNSKINVISRKDISHLYLHHVLHSLAISKWITFEDKSKILDVGCGGGFPGIPLAILYPGVNFHLVDSIRKKLTVVQDVCKVLKLNNVRTSHTRVEEVKKRYDFVVTRAVAPLPTLLRWTKKNISKKHHHPVPNGLIALKGGDLKSEINAVQKGEYIECHPISDYFDESFFNEKYIIYIQG